MKGPESGQRGSVPDDIGSFIVDHMGPLAWFLPGFIGDFLLKQQDEYMKQVAKHLRELDLSKIPSKTEAQTSAGKHQEPIKV